MKSDVEAFGDIVIIRPLHAPALVEPRSGSFSLTRLESMGATLFLLTCAFLGAQEHSSGQTQNALRLQRGQELVYHGQFVEESAGNGVQFRRIYRMDLLVLVLDAGPKGFDLAFFTSVKKKGGGDHGEETCSARLALGQVDPLGRLSLSNPQDVLIPLDSPATLETGVFVEFPEGTLQPQHLWRVGEDMRPERTWRFLGMDQVNGISCLKVEGIQESDSWSRPRADRPAWRRKDIVWISRRLGVATRVDRTIERREAAHTEPSQRCRVVYDLQGAVPYPPPLFADRKNEIMQALQFAKQAAPLLPNPTQQDPRSFDMLLAKIVKHIETTPETPYREAVKLVKQRVEAAKRGESPPDRTGAEYAEMQPRAALGRIAPDFVVSNAFNKDAVRLHNYAGREVLMVFFLPTSPSAEEVLRFAERMHRDHKAGLAVLGFTLADDVKLLRSEFEDFRLSFPIATGKPLRERYGLEATPQFVVIDPDGYVRSMLTGWGPETGATLEGDILRWLRPESPAKPAQPAQSSGLSTRIH